MKSRDSGMVVYNCADYRYWPTLPRNDNYKLRTTRNGIYLRKTKESGDEVSIWLQL